MFASEFLRKPHGMKFFPLLLIAFFTQDFYCQNQEFSAQQIIDHSIAYSGGEAALSQIGTLELIYLHLDPEGKSASIVEKRKNNTHLTQSIISQNNDSQTTFYDGKSIVWVRGKSLKKFQDAARPEIKLKAFSNLLYGYQRLGYSYNRLKDEKFENFDCYVVEAKNADGFATVNFFDKSNFRHLMTIFPNGNKLLATEDSVYDGVRINKHVLETDSNGKVSQLILVDAKINSGISNLWFTSPFEQSFVVPGDIRFGRFAAVGTGTVVTRDGKNQTEISGKATRNLQIDWKSDDMFELRTTEQLSGEGTVVRIVSWNNEGFVCHIMGLTAVGTDEFKKI